MDRIKQIFYDDNLGAISLKDLLKKAHSLPEFKEGKINNTKVKEFYANQRVSQVAKQTRTLKKHFLKIVAPEIGYLSADLMDFSKFSHANSGNKYILTVIDIYSRYAWAFPVKNKSPESILPHLKKVREDLGRKAEGYSWKTFTIDYGKEFLGSVKKYLDEQGVKIYLAQERDNSTFKLRAAIIERFNRTLSEKIDRATEVSGNTKWVGLLDKLVDAYNHREHRTIGRSPYDVFVKGKKISKAYKEDEREPPEVKIGDYVRTSVDQQGNLIRKRGLRGAAAYSDEVFQVLHREGNRYLLAKADTLQRAKGAEGSSLYLARQLLKVSPPEKIQEPDTKSSLQIEKKAAKTEKKLKTLQAREPEKLDPARLLGKKEREKADDAPRTKKKPGRYQD